MEEKKRKNNSPNQTDNVGWRPYWTWAYQPEELLEEAMKYFKHCEETLIENSYWKKIPRPKTISWLAKWLWVGKNYLRKKLNEKSFEGMLDYIYTNTENDIEEWAMLWFYNPTIAAKNLSANFDWREKSEIDNTNKNVDLNDTLTDEQKRLIANRILNDKWSDTINETNS